MREDSRGKSVAHDSTQKRPFTKAGQGLLLGYARASKGDVLHIIERIDEAEAGFRSLTENIGTTSPAGRMMMQMIGGFAEFERVMARERTAGGLAAARTEGRVDGRRKKPDGGKRREIAESVISGRRTGAEMARPYDVSPPAVSRIVSAHRTGLVDTDHRVR